MKYYDVGAIEKSLELPIGARFRFRDTLFEVAEANEGRMHPWGCSKCAFPKEDICEVMNCGRRHRHDGKCTYFKEIEE